MFIRNYEPADCCCLAALFYDTVHCINARDYTKEQLNAWASGTVNLQDWNSSFESHTTLVAIENEIIVGFGDIDDTGYLDRLYVHKDYQNRKIASALCSRLEQSCEAETIITHASITAKPFFIHRGYEVIQEQQVQRSGVLLTNFIMQKSRSMKE